MAKPWNEPEGPAPRLDGFDFYMLSGRHLPLTPDGREKLLRHLRSAGCIFSAGRVIGDGPARPEIREAERLLRFGHDAEAFTIIDELLARGPQED